MQYCNKIDLYHIFANMTSEEPSVVFISFMNFYNIPLQSPLEDQTWVLYTIELAH